jgi:phosphate transport system substrate-binding protein
VTQSPGSIGYVELIYALQNKTPYGQVQTATGDFVKASPQSVTAAAASVAGNMPADFRVSITNAPGAGAYPISSFTWLLMYEAPKDKAQGTVMVDFLKWALTDGQKLASELGYAPLPPEVVTRETETLEKIRGS